MKWEKRDISPELVKNIASKYGCDLLTASILIRRGILSAAEIMFFLEDDRRHLRNPFELPGMDDAVERILAAKEEGEKVLVFGDRDVDGICATAILTNFLLSQGMDVSARLPGGDEPYGLSLAAVEEFAAAYGTLIITVDCGISNVEEVKRAGELGIDVIITDHHNPKEEIPPALAIVNPKLGGDGRADYPFRDLAGCAVAYKLASALRFALKSELYGQPICLLNTRPLNDSWLIEIAKLRNLRLVETLTETVVPAKLRIEETRLPAFLSGEQILCWDADLQKKTLAKIFGNGVEIYMQDISGEIGKEIPSAAGKSLVRIREMSRLAKYSEAETGELDVFVNLFCSFIKQREKLFDSSEEQDLQLACLGTLSDIMPLKDENRIIVRQGLKSIMEKPRPGLSELLFKLELSGKRLGAADISWLLGPAINAAGRMGKPDVALGMLMEAEAKKRDSLADELIGLNEERKKIGESIWCIVEPAAGKNLKDYHEKLALAWGQEIPRGVTGIMASRLIGRFKVPSIVASMGEETITASLRSVRGYDLRFLLESCSEFFLDWGGHNFAAGFSMEAANWPPFLEHLKYVAKNMVLPQEEDEETLIIDAELPLSYLNPDIFTLIDRFEPYGEGNEALCLLARDLKISEISLMGKPEAKHVKLTVDAGQYKWPGVYWQAADKLKREFDLGDRVDMVFKVTRNFFRGSETPQLVVSDIKRSKV
ncbi:MAG: single-stranded-DNA-specific exonuclease RecJ [Treponema sp.]|nr:single-stranded-DNA-specific exonuclease RecJ [Treponema sp.]